MTDTTYAADTFLVCAIHAAAAEMLEKTGALRACRWLDKPNMKATMFADLKAAAEKAACTIAIYERAIADGRERFTEAEWDALGATDVPAATDHTAASDGREG